MSNEEKQELARKDPSELLGSFELEGYCFDCFIPKNMEEATSFLILVTKNKEVVRRDFVPMMYEPLFGVDMGDLYARDQRVEEIIKELGLT